MNAADLMLGDYVQVEDKEGNLIIDYICDIGYVPQWNELGVKTCKCGNEWLRESEIIPIPVTKEILEKNEFIFNRTLFDLEVDNSEILVVIDTPYNKPMLHIEKYTKKARTYYHNNFNYVHELQHALKLCGINKEIVL